MSRVEPASLAGVVSASSGAVTGVPASAGDPVARIGAEREMELLRRRIARWLDGVDEELRPPLRSAFAGKPKSFRPLTVFAAHRALNDERPSDTSISTRTRRRARPQHVADRR